MSVSLEKNPEVRCGPSCPTMRALRRAGQLCPYTQEMFWLNERAVGAGSIAGSRPVPTDNEATRLTRARGTQASLAHQAREACLVPKGEAASAISEYSVKERARRIANPSSYP